MGSIPGSGRSPGDGNGNLVQYSCLGNLMDRGVRRAAVHGVAKESDTTEQLTKQHKLTEQINACKVLWTSLILRGASK